MVMNIPNSSFVFCLISIYVIHQQTRIANANALPTVAPFVTPNPTTPTSSPSDGYFCGSYSYCWEINVRPVSDTLLSTPVTIQGNYYPYDTSYVITFNVLGAVACQDPSIDFRYERIDNDDSSEDLLLYSSYLPYTITCGGGTSGPSNSCNNYQTCVTGRSLNADVQSGESFTITVKRDSEVHALCGDYHSWAINAVLTLNCDARTESTDAPIHAPTHAPAWIPINTPTAAPTTPTLTPNGESIQITNPGFEEDDPSLVPNSNSHLNELIGWTLYDPYGVNRQYDSPGVSCPGSCWGCTSDQGVSFDDPIYGDSAPEGKACLYLWADWNEGAFGVEQELLSTFEPVTSYILSAKIGNQGYNVWTHWNGDYENWGDDCNGWSGYVMQLVAENTIVAQDDNSIYIPDQHWQAITVDYTTSSADVAIGKPIKIRLLQKNDATATGGCLMYDDVVLTAAAALPTPNPSDPTQSPNTTPSAAPIAPTVAPTSFPTLIPTLDPSHPSSQPPTLAPTAAPTSPSTDTPTRAPWSGTPTIHGQTMTPSGTPSGVPTPNHKQSANPTHKPSAHPIMIDPPTLYVGFVSSSIVTTVDASDTRDAQHGEMAPQKELLTDTMLILIAGVGSLIVIACVVYPIRLIYRLYVSSIAKNDSENMVHNVNNTDTQPRRVNSASEPPWPAPGGSSKGNVYNVDAIMQGSAKLTIGGEDENEKGEENSLSDDFWDKGKDDVVTSGGNSDVNDNADLMVHCDDQKAKKQDLDAEIRAAEARLATLKRKRSKAHDQEDDDGILDKDGNAIAEGKVIQMVITPGV
eukprot:847639_1